ncbi:MAG: helix-turn-helix domain-containing protein, partial [Actinomycetota bacterium]
MALTDPRTTPPIPAGERGRQLRAVRKAQGLSRSEVARSAGLTRRELAAYERGRNPVPDSDLWCLAGSCGVDVDDLLPTRDRLGVDSDLGTLTIGESVRRLRPGTDSDGVLREYLAMIYELRNLAPGSTPSMRAEDLATLAEALGGTPDAIEARL